MKWIRMNKGIINVWSQAWIGIKNAQEAFLETYSEGYCVALENEPFFPLLTEQGATSDWSKS